MKRLTPAISRHLAAALVLVLGLFQAACFTPESCSASQDKDYDQVTIKVEVVGKYWKNLASPEVAVAGVVVLSNFGGGRAPGGLNIKVNTLAMEDGSYPVFIGVIGLLGGATTTTSLTVANKRGPPPQPDGTGCSDCPLGNGEPAPRSAGGDPPAPNYGDPDPQASPLISDGPLAEPSPGEAPEGSEAVAGSQYSPTTPGPKVSPEGANFATGEMIHQDSDASFPSPGIDFGALRTFRSGAASRRGWFGTGWRSLFETQVDDYETTKVYTSSYGDQFRFFKKFNPIFGGSTFFVREGSVGPEGAVFASSTKFRVTYASKTSMDFELSTGSLISATDRTGNRISMTYGPDGAPLVAVDSVGRQTTFTTAQGLITSMTLPNGDRWTYSYTADDRLASVRDPRGNSTVYQYDSDGRLTHRFNAEGGTRAWTYDSDGRVASVRNESGGTTTMSYDPTGRATVYRNSAGETTRYEYDTKGFVTRVTRPGGAVWRNAWSANGELLETEDPAGRVDRYAYDAKHDLVQHTDPTGDVTRWTRHPEFGFVTSRTEPDGALTQLEYDEAGNLVKYLDALTQKTEFTYDTHGIVTSVFDPASRFFTFQLDGHGNRVRIDEPTGGRTAIAYDALSRPTQVVDPIGRIAQINYHLHRLPSTVTDAQGQVRSFEYDRLLNLVRVEDVDGVQSSAAWTAIQGVKVAAGLTDAQSRSTAWTYDGERRVSQVTNRAGSTVQFGRDLDGRITQRTDPRGGIARAAFSPDHRLTSLTDELGRTTMFSYDGDGRLNRVTDARGKSTTATYDVRDRPTEVVDRMGGRVVNTFNRVGRLVGSRDEEDGITAIAYDASGLPTSTQDPVGAVTRYGYDFSGRLNRLTDGANGITEYVRDLAGQITRVIDPAGRATANEFDALGRVTKITGPSGEILGFTYHPAGMLASFVDANGATTHYRYDPNRRLTEVEDPLGKVEHYTYTALGDLLSIVDRNGNSNTFRYSPLRELTEIEDAAGQKVTHSYDLAGQRTRTVNSRGQALDSTYDLLGRLTTRVTPEGSETFEYDDLGRRVSASNPTITQFFGYDRLGRLVSRSDSRGMSATHSYDPAGNLTTTTDSAGRVTQRRYDGMHRVTQLTDPRGKLTRITYDPSGLELERTSPNGVMTLREYDDSGRLTRLEHRSVAEDAALAVFAYGYDPSGNRSTETEVRRDGSSATLTYGYSPRNELVEARVVTSSGAPIRNFGSIAYTYDPAGNRLSQTVDGLTSSYQYNSLNQLTDLDGRSLEYDLDGNLTREALPGGQGRAYSWDSRNRLVQLVKEVSGGSPRPIASYFYDAGSLKVTAIREPDPSQPTQLRSIQQRHWFFGQVSEDRTYDEGQEGVQERHRSFQRLGLDVLQEVRDRVTSGTLGADTERFYFQDASGSLALSMGTGSGGPELPRPAIELVSQSTPGTQGTGASYGDFTRISDDGQVVVFVDPSRNLAPMIPRIDPRFGDRTQSQAYVRDRVHGTTICVSTDVNGVALEYHIEDAQISGNGKVVAFHAFFSGPIWLKDLETGQLEVASVTSAGVPDTSGRAFNLALSGDGRYVAFASINPSMVPGGLTGNGHADIFVRDRVAGTTERVSVGVGGVPSNHYSGDSPEGTGENTIAMSADGRFVAFPSYATNLTTTPDANGNWSDLYVHDRQTGTIERINVSSAGVQENTGLSELVSISGDGRFVLFHSFATDLVPGLTIPDVPQIYVRDRLLGTTELVSMSSTGVPADRLSRGIEDTESPAGNALSFDGRFAVYESDATNLVDDDLNEYTDIFVRDRQNGLTLRASLPTTAGEGDWDSFAPAISGDGRYISFTSRASNLIPGDVNEYGFDHLVVRNPFLPEGSAGGTPPTSGALIATYSSYRPFGEPIAVDPESPFGFQGLQVEDTGDPSDPLYAAQYRHVSARQGRFINRDPGGFIDGPNRYRWLRGNPNSFRDPDGRNPVLIYFGAAAAIGAVANMVINREASWANARMGAALGIVSAPLFTMPVAAIAGRLGLGVFSAELLQFAPALGGVGAASAAAVAAAEADLAAADAAAGRGASGSCSRAGQVASSYPRGRRVGGGREGPRASDPRPGIREEGAWEFTQDNLARMERGQPPIGQDGLPVELHHRGQNPAGPLDELMSTTHQGIDHPLSPSQIDRGAFAGQRGRYWVDRARGLLGQD